MAKQAESILVTFKSETLGKRSSVLPGSHQAVELFCISMGTAGLLSSAPRQTVILGKQKKEGQCREQQRLQLLGTPPLAKHRWVISLGVQAGKGEGAEEREQPRPRRPPPFKTARLFCQRWQISL